MDKLYTPGTINEIKEQYGFQFSKNLGQNFLIDKNIVDKIIAGALIQEGDLVLEIGPGIGVLTAEAAKIARKVIAIEIDRYLIPILNRTLSIYENVEIINKDVLKIDLNELLEQNGIKEGQKGEGVKIIGNLPYYITTPIIMKILEEGVKADSITIMLQKEVAERIKAEAGSKTYGAITVAAAYYCTVSFIANVPKEVFMPRPKVDSSVIRFNIRREKEDKPKNEQTFFAVVKAGFGQRRKTMHNALTGIYGMTKEEVRQALTKAGIDPARRAETLSVREFVAISDQIDEKRGG